MWIRERSGLIVPMLLALTLLAPRAGGDSNTRSRTLAPGAEEAATKEDTRSGTQRSLHAAPGAVAPERGALGAALSPSAARAARVKEIHPANAAEVLARFKKEEKARRDAEAAKIQQELAKLAQGGNADEKAARLEAIREETLAIQKRAQGASANARAADEARLQALWQETQALLH